MTHGIALRALADLFFFAFSLQLLSLKAAAGAPDAPASALTASVDHHVTLLRPTISAITSSSTSSLATVSSIKPGTADVFLGGGVASATLLSLGAALTAQQQKQHQQVPQDDPVDWQQLFAKATCQLAAAGHIGYWQTEATAAAFVLAREGDLTSLSASGFTVEPAAGVEAAIAAATAVAGVKGGCLAVLSAFSAAAAADPASPEPWRAFGDVLWDISTQAPSPSPHPRAAKEREASGLAEESQAEGQQRQALLGLVAEAYCQFLRAGVVSRRLTSPEEGMHVLLRLLQLVLQHASELTLAGSSSSRSSNKKRGGTSSKSTLHVQPLWQLLSRCPAAAWQALTPQLMGQLMKVEQPGEVREVVCGLLRAVAVAVPCSVLYPAVMELRNAQVTGRQVRNCFKRGCPEHDTHRNLGVSGVASCVDNGVEHVM